MPRESSKARKKEGRRESPALVFRPLTPRLIDDLGTVLREGWGRSCWCMHLRLTDAQIRDLPGPDSANQRRRDAITKLARRRRAPGLLAFEGDEPVGWIAVAPRSELARVDASRATPRVDERGRVGHPVRYSAQDGPRARYRARLDPSGRDLCYRERRSDRRSLPPCGRDANGRRQRLLRDRAAVPSCRVPGHPKATEEPPAQLGPTSDHARQSAPMRDCQLRNARPTGRQSARCLRENRYAAIAPGSTRTYRQRG